MPTESEEKGIHDYDPTLENDLIFFLIWDKMIG